MEHKVENSRAQNKVEQRIEERIEHVEHRDTLGSGDYTAVVASSIEDKCEQAVYTKGVRVTRCSACACMCVCMYACVCVFVYQDGNR